MIPKKILIIFIYINNFVGKFVNGLKADDDLHSSVMSYEGVLNAEKYLIDNLAHYITESEENIQSVKRFLSNLKKDQQQISQCTKLKGLPNETIYQLFPSIKQQLAVDFPILQYSLNKTISETVKNFQKVKTEYNLPTINDLEGVTMAILRVQEVYNVSAEEIADGYINGINFGKRFTAADCLVIGLHLKVMEKYYYAIDWFKITLKRIKNDGWKGIIPEIHETIILDLLSYSQYKEGGIKNAEAAIKTNLNALKMNSYGLDAIHLAGNLKEFLQHYTDLKLGVKQSTGLEPPDGALNRYNLTLTDYLKKACRGELKKSPKEERKLFCKYETKNHPYLILAPIKVEILNLSPYHAVFHDVIYDSEIKILKELSIDKLERATVWNAVKGAREPSFVRTSKYAGLENETHPLMHILNQRISDMTGLTMDTSENYQLMNYGIGGHYDIHPDFFIEPDENNNIKPYAFHSYGNRIATVLFYMSDVSIGGHTVWPLIKVLTNPKKGTAAFWYNTFSDDQPNYNTQHSACPIIVGSKWVLNKWIRIRGQIFRKPCNLVRDS